MNSELVVKKNKKMLEQRLKRVSPYGPEYPVVFLSNCIQEQLDLAEIAAQRVYNEAIKHASMVAQLKEATKKGFRLVVDASESTLKDIESGKIKLTTENGGKMYAQIREANGHYGSKLPIKKEVFAKGADPVQVANAMQMRALQNQVQQISDQIVIIDQSVREVIQGQQNDRIGLYYSGQMLYLEAQNVNNPELRKSLISQSLRSLSDATFQLALTMDSDIKYLETGGYKEARGKSASLIDSRMRSINQSFAYIHQAFMMRAGIYCKEGELLAMAAALKEYSQFIDNSIAPYANLLAQCDINDNGTASGIWESRKNLKLDVAEFAKQLDNPEKTLYLGVAEEGDHESN